MGIASLAGGSAPGFLKDGLARSILCRESHGRFHRATSGSDCADSRCWPEGDKRSHRQGRRSGLSADSKFDVNHELQVKQAQFENALAESLGLSALATVAPEKEPSGPFARFFGYPASFQVAIPGQEFWVKVHATNPTSVPVNLGSVVLETPQGEQWTIDPATQSGGTLAGNQSRIAIHRPRSPKRRIHRTVLHAAERRAALLRHHRAEISQSASSSLSDRRQTALYFRRRSLRNLASGPVGQSCERRRHGVRATRPRARHFCFHCASSGNRAPR